ncbi:hypothetical protein [Bacillus mycoides]|uniref:Uncharacterized protein n=1 Tax=Bacillus mycoides TaxID=1405 RepID=A0AAP8KS71_BACMY|nr:hypothetical protein [Bacillus mycoides]PJN50712.1 hypothetical protein BAWEI_61650 [Bacillus mycoides]PJN64529.1 hypothetical protein BACWE_50950 [Bacillus mycoides]
MYTDWNDKGNYDNYGYRWRVCIYKHASYDDFKHAIVPVSYRCPDPPFEYRLVHTVLVP